MILSGLHLNFDRFGDGLLQMTGDAYFSENTSTYRVSIDVAVSLDGLRTDGQGELRALLDLFESMVADKVHMSAFRGQPAILHL